MQSNQQIADQLVSKQWEAAPGKKLTGYESYLDACKWTGQILLVQPIVFWAESYRACAHEIRLQNVLLDSCQRVEGITLVQRITFRPELVLINCSVLLWPYAGVERVPANGKAGS